jgi:hypothetical protein
VFRSASWQVLQRCGAAFQEVGVGGTEQVRGDRRFGGGGGGRRVAQVFGEQHAGYGDDDVEVGVRAEDFVAGAQDGVRVGDVDADGVDAVLGLGLRPLRAGGSNFTG